MAAFPRQRTSGEVCHSRATHVGKAMNKSVGQTVCAGRGAARKTLGTLCIGGLLVTGVAAWAQQTDADKLSRALREIEALKARLAEVERSLTNQTRSVV